MYFNHININHLTNLEVNYYLGVKVRACAQRMRIGKDKVYDITNYLNKDLQYKKYIVNILEIS